MFTYILLNHPNSLPIDTKEVDTIFARLQEVIDRPQQGIVNIICVDEEEIRKWNKEYRGKDKETDILTFPYFEDFSECKEDDVVGEILICLDQLKNQSKQWVWNDCLLVTGNWLLDEYYRILVHGLVHLLGYDHETEEDWEEMRGIEEKISR